MHPTLFCSAPNTSRLPNQLTPAAVEFAEVLGRLLAEQWIHEQTAHRLSAAVERQHSVSPQEPLPATDETDS